MIVMEFLFDDGPIYDPHIKGILKLMLSRLRNNKPRQDSPVYRKNADFLQEIYDGKFLHRNFNMTRKDYDYTNVFDKVKLCIGNWSELRSAVQNSLDNLDLAKDEAYLPFGKEYINKISFSSFFISRDMGSDGISSNFINFINPPRKKSFLSMKSKIDKEKKNILPLLIIQGEKIASKHFDGYEEFNFWCAVSDFTRWLKSFKLHFPSQYSEFILGCEEGNPLLDLKIYTENQLRKKFGDSFTVKAYFFRLSLPNSDRLGGNFLDWLLNGISGGKFAVLRDLPKSIDRYCKDDDFDSIPQVKERKKETIDIDSVIF